MKRALAIAIAALSSLAYGAAPIKEPSVDSTLAAYDQTILLPDPVLNPAAPFTEIGPIDVSRYRSVRVTAAVTRSATCGNEQNAWAAFFLAADGVEIGQLVQPTGPGGYVGSTTLIDLPGQAFSLRVYGMPNYSCAVRILVLGRSN